MEVSGIGVDKILISACLLGERVRYDAGDNQFLHGLLTRWQAEGRLVPVCPEVKGGLPVPRPPAEIQSGDGSAVLNGDARVMTRAGADVTGAFIAGAHRALEQAQQHRCRFALLAARSPSCGSTQIHDGSFTGKLIDGQGTTAALLTRHNVQVFDPAQIEILAERLDT